MKKIFYLKNCSSCKRIIDKYKLKGFEQQELKTNPLTETQLEELRKKAGSYEALFSRRAQKYKALGLKELSLTEEDYKGYLLEDYTFLKRPVIIDGESIFIGSDKKNLESLERHFPVREQEINH